MRPRKDRPPSCPECSSPRTVWNGGVRFLCKECGKQTTKRKRRRSWVPDESRTPCPRCGSRHVYKKSPKHYHCTQCGRVYLREPLEEF